MEDEHGGPLTVEDFPSMRLMADQPADPLLMHVIDRQTGEAWWRLLKAAPIHDDHGDVIAAVTVIEDVTAVKTAEVRTAVLAESGRVLASSLDYEQTLENVARVARARARRHLRGRPVRRGSLARARVHRAPGLAAPAAGRATPPARARSARSVHAVHRVLRSGEPELFSDTCDELLASSALGDEHLALLRALSYAPPCSCRCARRRGSSG